METESDVRDRETKTELNSRRRSETSRRNPFVRCLVHSKAQFVMLEDMRNNFVTKSRALVMSHLLHSVSKSQTKFKSESVWQQLKCF